MSGTALYAAVFFAALGESTALLGLLIPGVGVVVGAGALAARGAGNLVGVALCASAGSILGFGLSYYAGRAGSGRLERWSRRAPAALGRAGAFLDRFGGWGVFLGHFFGPVRACIALVAGAGRLSPRRFWVASVAGALVWGFGLAAVGAAVSGGWQLVEVALGRGSLLLGAFAALLYVTLRVSAGALALGLRLLPPTSASLLAFLDRHRELPWLRRLVPGHPHILAWVRRRLEPDHATGLLLSTGAAACAGFAWVFFVVLEGLLFHEPLIQFDQRVYHLLQTLRTPRGDVVFLLLTCAGSGPVLAVAAAAGTAALLALRRRFEAGLLLLGFGSGELLTWALKYAVARPRPTPDFLLALETSAAFPSNHAFSSVALFGFLSYAASKALGSEGAKARLFSFVGVMVVAVGVSRLYLGAHWPSDVAAGYALGGIWLSALVTAAEAREKFSGGPPVFPRRRAAACALTAAAAVLAAWGAMAWQTLRDQPSLPTSGPALRQVAQTGLGPELAVLARAPVEGLVGEEVGRIALFAAADEATLRHALETGGWTPTEGFHAAFVLQRWVDAVSGSVAPEAAAYPLFWRERPHALAFALAGERKGRWVARGWRTGLSSVPGGEVWALGVRRELPPANFFGTPSPLPPGPQDAEARVVSALAASPRPFRQVLSRPAVFLASPVPPTSGRRP